MTMGARDMIDRLATTVWALLGRGAVDRPVFVIAPPCAPTEGTVTGTPVDLEPTWRHLLRDRKSDAMEPDELGWFGRRRLRAALSHVDRPVVTSPRNAFRMALLADVFPGAEFVLVVGDQSETIAAMVDGDGWTCSRPPGWQYEAGAPAARRCAWSWRAHVEAMQNGAVGLDHRWVADAVDVVDPVT